MHKESTPLEKVQNSELDLVISRPLPVIIFHVYIHDRTMAEWLQFIRKILEICSNPAIEDVHRLGADILDAKHLNENLIGLLLSVTEGMQIRENNKICPGLLAGWWVLSIDYVNFRDVDDQIFWEKLHQAWYSKMLDFLSLIRR